jgi:molybdopterin-guanine dinucleotide biosynthesis protein A
MNCVVVAGGRLSPGDPLFPYTNGKPKALIDINGKPMINWIIDAIQGVNIINQVAVVGLENDPSFEFDRPIHFISDQGSLVANVMAGLNWERGNNSGSDPVLFSSSDIPAITGDIVQNFIDTCRPFDKAIYYSVVTKEIMEARFPGSKRTYARFREHQVAGGDIFVVQSDVAEANPDLWPALENIRKHPWKIARLAGPFTLVKYLLRQLTIAEVNARATRVLGRPFELYISKDAEIAMDADKPYQVDLLRTALKG